MRIVLVGDSHLDRVRRGLGRIGEDVDNRAVGGSTADQVARQLLGVTGRLTGRVHLHADDIVVVSIGTNDALRGRPLDDFTADIEGFLRLIGGRRTVLVGPPLPCPHADRVAALVATAGGTVIDTGALIAPLAERAFTEDGIHLTGAAYDLLLPAIAAAATR